MTDNADLIRRLNDEADNEEFLAGVYFNWCNASRAEEHAERAALLREAAKALESP
jgi:hypothetical protein